VTRLGSLFAFGLGVALAIRVLAALYGIIDLWHAIGTYYPRVLRGVAGWSGATLLVAALLEGAYRISFGLGLLAFALGYASLYGLRHLVVRPLTPSDPAPRSIDDGGRPAAGCGASPRASGRP
jgi:hypothetical protein